MSTDNMFSTRALDERAIKKKNKYFSYFSMKIYAVGTC